MSLQSVEMDIIERVDLMDARKPKHVELKRLVVVHIPRVGDSIKSPVGCVYKVREVIWNYCDDGVLKSVLVFVKKSGGFSGALESLSWSVKDA